MSEYQSVWEKLDRPLNLLRVLPGRKTYFRMESEGAIDYDIPVSGDIKIGARWHRLSDANHDLLYFHGNGEVVGDYNTLAAAFGAAGFNLFIVDYRGYGWSDGSATFRTILPDAHQVVKFFLEKVEGRKRPYLMGRSIGSAPATELALKYSDHFDGLILESSFSDPIPLFLGIGIDVSSIQSDVRTIFGNHLKLKSLKLPLLVIHAADDQLFPANNAQENFASVAHQRKKIVIIPDAGHNNLLLSPEIYFGSLRDFKRSVETKKF